MPCWQHVRFPSIHVLLAAAVAAAVLLLSATPQFSAAGAIEQSTRGGDGRLTKVEPLFDSAGGDLCATPAALQLAERHLTARGSALGQTSAPTAFADPPVRNIRDKYPAFAAIGVDSAREEVIVTDENLFQILVYDRREDTPENAEASRPKRTISGANSLIEFQSGLYIDQENGDIYAPNNDTVDTLVMFSHGSAGDVVPKRTLRTPHGTFGIAVDERRKEMFLTTQHDSSVVVFRQGASTNEAPIRLLQGDDTGLADPHGIVIDPRKQVFYVANYGSRASRDSALERRAGAGSDAGQRRDKPNWPLGREYAAPGSGTHSAPSISIHALAAAGNTPPLGKIQGPKTQLNWPTGLAFDPQRGELYVANDMGPSILVFDADDRGDVAPKRVLIGPKTKLFNPTGVALDLKNSEMWVANFGSHSATVYPLNADGDTPPLRTIRGAPEEAPALMIGNPGALTYDSTREEILVPN